LVEGHKKRHGFGTKKKLMFPGGGRVIGKKKISGGRGSALGGAARVGLLGTGFFFWVVTPNFFPPKTLPGGHPRKWGGRVGGEIYGF